jgi:NADH-quinone oxidoreductase subunit L
MVSGGIRQIAYLVPILPISAFFLIVLFGKRTPGKGAPIGILATAAAFVIGLGCFADAISRGGIVERSVTWINFSSFHLELGIRVDGLASMMFVVVCLVSLLVQIYSLGYMHGDTRYTWYYAMLNLFTGSMLTLVIANNLVQLLVGWELVGICSYLLIGHWFEEKENSDAAIKAFLTTRTGDLGFDIGIFVLFVGAHTFNIGQLQQRVAAGTVSPTVITAGAILLFAGAVGKSAQVPLHVWLPDAMAGPTPVSALIHAATMVTAGVYMVARLFTLFSASHAVLAVISVIASVTMVFAALLACVQRDIKRVLAYSTVSQLGYMMAALSVGAGVAGVFHLWTHAFFKALLFLGAGSVIHAVHTNDMHEMGGLLKYMPVTGVTFLVGTLALAGVPPFAGFWSKDEIVTAAWTSGHKLVFLAALVTAFLTAFYMARACTLTFFGSYRRMPIAGGAADGHHHEQHLPHESPRSMTVPLVVLGILSFGAGFIGIPGHSLFADWVPVGRPHEAAAVPWLIVLSVAVALAGIGLGWRMYSGAQFGFGVVEPLERLGALYRAAVRRFFVDDFYLAVFVRPVQYRLSSFVYKFLDQKVIDGAVNDAAKGTVLVGRVVRATDEGGVDGVVNAFAWLTNKLSFGLRRTQTGNVQRYAIGLFVGVVVVAAVVIGGLR